MPDPQAGPGEVLLKVHSCGVCFHDVINRQGDLPRTRAAAILGHEAQWRPYERRGKGEGK